MNGEAWIHLRVRNPERSRRFFSALGFRTEKIDLDRSGARGPAGEGPGLRLLPGPTFRSFPRRDPVGAGSSGQVLFSFLPHGRTEVDALARRVEGAGGEIFTPPTEIQGWMYGFAFTDPDGHRWNVIHMPVPGGVAKRTRVEALG